MSNNRDWVPVREQDLADLCEKWNVVLKKADNITRFGWNTDAVGEVLARIKAFLEARAAYAENDSTKNRMAKDEAKTAVRAGMRDFANTSVRFNKEMKDEDKAELGIRAADKNPTPVGVPGSYPEAESDTSIIRQITIHSRDSASKKRGKRIYFCLRWETTTNSKGPYGEIGQAIIP